ncbi:ImmA/IrrE family metallo-endopeptidase [Pseudomonas aegrilactucae]|uniref:ImmA/IrrE family metallo-endopeptidase n=1 Tax=Pseudomonas aegrilactucae TaxID=2854028 RepID=A0A9Q2XJN7_9PSED|nr:ImmA/IrrE family metallo-endopeptidase [Pseudomonas aegrilactucae]MBV6287384.1 ImmA/IrrE family metallo-endopeptidase [Pseudomonas aegrilactucae]
MPTEVASMVLNRYWDGQLPIDPIQLAVRAGATVIGDPELEREGLSGAFQFDDSGRPVIRFNPYEQPTRQRFTIAHELGHMMMNHIIPGERVLRDPKMAYTSGYEQPREMQANQFAAQLLMPEAVVRSVARYGVDSRTISDMARGFNVSEVAMGYRLKNLGMY